MSHASPTTAPIAVIEVTDTRTRKSICGCAGINRYGILVVGLLYFSSLLSCLISYNATFVSMMDKTSSPLYNLSIMSNIDAINGSQPINWESSELPLGDRRFSYKFMEKSLSFAGAFLGAMLGTFPINSLIAKFGAHKIMTFIGILTTTVTAITPIVASTSFPLFVCVRFLAGLSMSNIFPVAGIIVNDWATGTEKGLFVAVLSGYVEVASLFTMPMSGVISTFVNWPFVFYIHAIMCASLTLAWALYYRDKPHKHPFVSKKEFHKISIGKAPSKTKISHPVRRIIRSISIWAVWCAVLGTFLVSQFSVSYFPMYLTYVLGYTPLQSGLIIIIPLVFLLIIKFSTGFCSDRITCISELSKLKLFNSLALLGSGVFFIVASMVKPTGGIVDVILVVIPVALLGFASGGYPKAAVVVSRQHSPFVMAVVQIIAAGSLMFGSFIVPLMTSVDDFAHWGSVFVLYAGVLLVCNTIFIALATAEPAKWTLDKETVAQSEDVEDNSSVDSTTSTLPEQQRV